MATKYSIPVWANDTTGAVDASVQQAILLPPSLDALMVNAALLPDDLRIPLRQTISVPGGATANVVTWTAPFACTIVDAGGYKTVANGGAGDTIELVTLVGPANIITWDTTVADELPTPALIDDAIVDVAAGQVLTIHRTEVTAAEANIWFDIVPQ